MFSQKCVISLDTIMKISHTLSAVGLVLGVGISPAFAQNGGVPADVAPYLQGHVSEGDVRRAEESGQFRQLGSRPGPTAGFILTPGGEEGLSPDAGLAEDDEVTTGSIRPRVGHRGRPSTGPATRGEMLLH
jgi:hypothetical protein